MFFKALQVLKPERYEFAQLLENTHFSVCCIGEMVNPA